MQLKSSTLEEIDKLIPRYPSKKSAVLPLLHLIQEELGYISDCSMEWVAEKLDIAPIAVLECVTFYPMFRREPAGKLHIKVCRTLPCALRGSYSLCKTLQDEFACKLGETSADKNYTVEFVECLASCGTAPVVQVNQTLHENVSPDKAKAFADSIKKQAEEPAL